MTVKKSQIGQQHSGRVLRQRIRYHVTIFIDVVNPSEIVAMLPIPVVKIGLLCLTIVVICTPEGFLCRIELSESHCWAVFAKMSRCWHSRSTWNLTRDLHLWVGDNIYADAKEDPGIIQQCYDTLATKPGFKELRSQGQHMFTWDDHDFGDNNEGRHYKLKQQSKKLFVDFWGLEKAIPKDRDGVYYSKIIRRWRKSTSGHQPRRQV